MGYILYLNDIIHPSSSVIAFPTWSSPRKQKRRNKRQQTSLLLGSALKWERLVLCHTPVGLCRSSVWADRVGLGAGQPLLSRAEGVGGWVEIETLFVSPL